MYGSTSSSYLVKTTVSSTLFYFSIYLLPLLSVFLHLLIILHFLKKSMARVFFSVFVAPLLIVDAVAAIFAKRVY